MIPEEAVQAACHAYRHPNRMVTNTSDGRHRDCMEAALEAALPAIEAALRTQIAAEIRLGINEYSGQLIEQAARIAEEGNTK